MGWWPPQWRMAGPSHVLNAFPVEVLLVEPTHGQTYLSVAGSNGGAAFPAILGRLNETSNLAIGSKVEN